MRTISELFASALQSFQSGQFPLAEHSFRQVLDVQPTHLDALHLLGIVLSQTGRHAEAVEMIGHAVRLSPQTAVLHSNLGLALKAQGKLVEAIQCYQTALRLQPEYADAYCNQGSALQALGRLDEAIASYQRAVGLNPNYAAAYSHLGAALQGQGKLDDAIANYQRALRLNPNDASALNNLGTALEGRRKLDEAIDCFRQAIRINPRFATAHSNLGSALKAQGKFDEANDCFQTALSLDPSDAVAHYNLAAIFEAQGQLEAAVNAYQTAIGLAPDYYAAHNNLGTARLKQKKYEEAAASYRQAAQIKPNFSGAHNNLGAALEGLDRLDEAIDSYRRAIQLNSNDAGTYSNLGNALQKQNKLDDAVAQYQQALRLNPDYVTAHSNLGTVLQKQCKLDEAIASYQNALRLNSGYPEARYNLGMAWLQTDQFASGWPEYEWRIKVNNLPEFRQPKWDGSPLAGRRILVLAEQGLGDTLQFIRYARFVKQRGGHVIVACQPALMDLLNGLDGIDELIPQPTDQNPQLPQFDIYSYLLSVPGVVGTTLNSIPSSVPYLNADEQLVAKWRVKLAYTDEFKIGIVWQGNRLNPTDRSRSFSLSEFQPIANVPRVRLLSLQKGDGCEQIASHGPNLNLMVLTDIEDGSPGPFLETFSDTAAIIKNLDLVISADTSVAHLAGALGVRVWLALNRPSDWRWLLDREDSPWYPTMRIFRQQKPGEWSEVFRRMAEELQQFCKCL